MGAFTTNTDDDRKVKATDLPAYLLSHGVVSVTAEEIASTLSIPQTQVSQRIASLIRRGELVSPARGLWVPVSPEYRTWGAPEAIEYIDVLMRHLGAEYYVGWLSAAAVLGATHHASQVFQVATSKMLRNRVVGRSDIRFYQRSNVLALPTFRFRAKSGPVIISTRAATMLSITNDIGLASGLDNATNIIVELSETEEPYLQEIADCSHLFPIAALRRLSWILDNYTNVEDLDVLAEISNASDVRLSKLSAHDQYSDRVDKKWALDINRKVEPDV